MIREHMRAAGQRLTQVIRAAEVMVGRVGGVLSLSAISLGVDRLANGSERVFAYQVAEPRVDREGALPLTRSASSFGLLILLVMGLALGSALRSVEGSSSPAEAVGAGNETFASYLPIIAGPLAPDVGHRDFGYGRANAPTGQKPQSKLWHNDGVWWGDLYNTATDRYEIYRFDWAAQAWTSTGAAIDRRARSSADVLWDGNHLYVASAVPPGQSGDLNAYLFRYSYSSASKTYSLDTGYPVSLGSVAVDAIVLDKDTTGKIWITYTLDTSSTARSVYVMRSTTDDRTFTPPFVVPTNGSTNLTSQDISAVVAFNSQIGVMWSNQANDAIYFAIHRDGDPDNAWSLNPALQGPRYADDHISIKSLQADPSGQVFAAVKTSLNDVNPPTSTQPLVLLLTMDQHGSWSRRTFGRVVDSHTRPIVLLDRQNREVYVFATVPVGSPTNGAIYYKKVSLDDQSMQFAVGPGTPFISFGIYTHINNASSTKQALDSSTGLLVVAGDDTSKYYFHNVLDLGATNP